MTDSENQWDQTPSTSPWPMRIGLAVVALVVLNLILWVVQGKFQSSDKDLKALDAQLTEMRHQIDAAHANLFEEKKTLDNAKTYIESGLAKDRKKAAADYQTLVTKYENDTNEYKTMAGEYNKRVAEFQNAGTGQKRWILIPFPIRVSAD